LNYEPDGGGKLLAGGYFGGSGISDLAARQKAALDSLLRKLALTMMLSPASFPALTGLPLLSDATISLAPLAA
jgi:hypothetical protein